MSIRDLLIQFYSEAQELNLKVKESMLENASGQQKETQWSSTDTSDNLNRLIWSGNSPDLYTWLCIGHGLALKADFHYEESCRVLEDRWKLVQSDKGVEVLVLGLTLGEVMGLHIGRFEEALAVVELSLRVADELQPLSEATLQLVNMKAAILIHSSSVLECLEFCTEVIPPFRDASTSEVSFGTALYFFLTAYTCKHCTSFFACNTSLTLENYDISCEETARNAWMARTEHTTNSLVEHIRLSMSALLMLRDERHRHAEDLIQQAIKLAKRDFPTSIYAELCSFWGCIVGFHVQELRGVAELCEEGECVRTHFPASHLRAAILHINQIRMKNATREWQLEQFQTIHQIVKAQPTCDLFIANIENQQVQYMMRNQLQLAIDLLQSTLRTLSEHYFTSINYSICFTSLCTCYDCANQNESIFELCREVLQTFQATHSTHQNFITVLNTLAGYFENQSSQEALTICLEHYQFLRSNHPQSQSFSRAVSILANMYQSQYQKEKAAGVYLEGIQIAKQFGNCETILEFIGPLLSLPPYNYQDEKKIEILVETHRFLVQQASPYCFKNAKRLIELYSKQPERAQEIFLEVYHALQESPTSEYFGECVSALPRFYKKRNELEKAIEVRLGAYRVLLAHPTCANFFDNVCGLANLYWEMNKREQALEFLLVVHRLLLAHPTCNNFQSNLKCIEEFCNKLHRFEVALEIFVEAYRILQSTEKAQCDWVVIALCQLYRRIGNTEAALQLEKVVIGMSFSQTRDLEALVEVYFSTDNAEAAVDLSLKVVQFQMDQRLYEQVVSNLKILFNLIKDSERRSRVIEACINVIRFLKQANEEKITEDILNLLFELSEKSKLCEKEIEVITKTLKYFLSCSHDTTLMAKSLSQAGSLYVKMSETAKAEFCLCRVARMKMCYSSTEKSALRSYYKN